MQDTINSELVFRVHMRAFETENSYPSQSCTPVGLVVLKVWGEDSFTIPRLSLLYPLWPWTPPPDPTLAIDAVRSMPLRPLMKRLLVFGFVANPTSRTIERSSFECDVAVIL